jgi:hypothetical protein
MLQTNFINYYGCIYNPTVVKSIPISDWFKLIYNSEYSEKITSARNGLLDYNKTKASLPCITYNFLYNGYKKDSNIISSTGFLYIDIDDKSFDIKILDENKVLAYYKSFGGKGYAIIVRVDGLNQDNFKSTYCSITEDLGVALFIDKNAIKASQFNVLSYDKDIFTNEDSYVFKALNKKVSSTIIKPFSTNIKKVSSTIIIKDGEEKEKKKGEEEKCLDVNDTFLNSKIRFNNINDYFIGSEDDYKIFANKEKLCIPFIPQNIKEGCRNTTVFSILSQYALLNINADNGFLKSLAGSINLHCYPSLCDLELNSIVASVVKKRADGTLVTNYNSDRRIIFNPNSKLTPIEKQKKSAVLMGKFKTDKTQQAMCDSIEAWNFEEYGKITQAKIAEKTNKSVVTIKRNWHPFKDYVHELNTGFKYSLDITEDSNDIGEVLNVAVIEAELVNDAVLDGDSDSKNTKYSNIEFGLWNGQKVLVLNKFLEKWNDSTHKKGLMNYFKKSNNNQNQFDYDLLNRFTYFGD